MLLPWSVEYRVSSTTRTTRTTLDSTEELDTGVYLMIDDNMLVYTRRVLRRSYKKRPTNSSPQETKRWRTWYRSLRTYVYY